MRERAHMRKTATLFLRTTDRRHVTNEPNPECSWVFTEPAVVATRKFDGTCCMFDGDYWWARREVKPDKPIPHNYRPISVDEVTRKTVGYEPISQSAFVKFHTEALATHDWWPAGTYELCGPKINGNPENLAVHTLIPRRLRTQYPHHQL